MSGSSEDNIMYQYSGDPITYIDIPIHTDTYTYDACTADDRISNLTKQLSDLREEITLLQRDKAHLQAYSGRVNEECRLGHEMFDRLKEAMERAAARLHVLSKLRDLEPEDADLHRYNLACMKVDRVRRLNVILLGDDKVYQTDFKPFIPGSLVQVLQLHCTDQQIIITVDYDSVADCLVVDDGMEDHVVSAELNSFDVMDLMLLKIKSERWDALRTDDTTNYVTDLLKLPVRVIAQSRTCISAQLKAEKHEQRSCSCDCE